MASIPALSALEARAAAKVAKRDARIVLAGVIYGHPLQAAEAQPK
jgi:hypothetical protein